MSGIGTINRSAIIFDLFINGEYELSPTDVSQKAGMSISTAARTLQALSEEKLLVKSTTRGKFRLGSRILDKENFGLAQESWICREPTCPI